MFGARKVLIPIVEQTQGKPGMRILKARVCPALIIIEIRSLIHHLQVKMYGIGSLWYGAFATAAATFVGHYPVRALLTSINARPQLIELVLVVWNVQLPSKSESFP